MFFAFFNLFGSMCCAHLSADPSGVHGNPCVCARPGHCYAACHALAGRLVTKVSPKGLLCSALCFRVFDHLMSQFSLGADFGAVIWPRVVLGWEWASSLSPHDTHHVGHQDEEMANASAIYNLLRNLGGSFGVAFGHHHARQGVHSSINAP